MNNGKKLGSASVISIMVLSFLMLSCSALQERIIDYAESESIDVKAENLLRKTEGATIIAKEKVVEATQRLYDMSTDRNDFKDRIESYSYRKKYISEIENLSDVNIENVKIDFYRNNLEQDGKGLYNFVLYITVNDGSSDMKREIQLIVTLKNLFKEKNQDIVDENNQNQGNIKPDENVPEGNIPEIEIPEKYDARDALIFRVERE